MYICHSFFSKALIESNVAAFISLKNANIVMCDVSRTLIWTYTFMWCNKKKSDTKSTAGRTNIVNKKLCSFCAYIARLKNLWDFFSSPLRYLEFSFYIITILLSDLNSGFYFKIFVLFSIYFGKCNISRLSWKDNLFMHMDILFLCKTRKKVCQLECLARKIELEYCILTFVFFNEKKIYIVHKKYQIIFLWYDEWMNDAVIGISALVFFSNNSTLFLVSPYISLSSLRISLSTSVNIQPPYCIF